MPALRRRLLEAWNRRVTRLGSIESRGAVVSGSSTFTLHETGCSRCSFLAGERARSAPEARGAHPKKGPQDSSGRQDRGNLQDRKKA